MIFMNSIYLDTVFVVNFIADYITFISSAKLSGAIIRRKLFIIASILGALYACIHIFYSDTWLSLPVIELITSIFICLIAFGYEEHFFRSFICFILISAIFGGILSIFVYNENNVDYLPINLKSFILFFTGMYFVLSVFFQGSFSPVKEYQIAKIKINNRCIYINVLKDTGNELLDHITNTPVMVIEKQHLVRLIPEIAMYKENDPTTLFQSLYDNPYFKTKVRLLPCQTVNGKGILLAFQPDEVMIGKRKTEHLVACVDMQFSPTNRYQGIY